MKKIIFNAIEIVLFVILLFAAVMNFKTGTTSQFAVSHDGKIVIVSTFFVIIASYVIGCISGLTYSMNIGERYKEMLAFYSRKNEKLSQQNEIDTDDKEALQRKIATLEIALDNALKNKNQ